MKKALLIILFIGGAYQLQAQQFNLKPGDSLLLNSQKSFYGLKLSDSTLFKNFLVKPQSDNLAALKGVKLSNTTEVFYSRMPVLKVQGNDNMAIIKPFKTNEHYTMLIKRIKVVDPLAKQAVVTP